MGRFALIVANERFVDPGLAGLRAPSRDAEVLARVLGDPDVGDFEVDVALDQDEPTVRRRIAQFFAGRRRDDTLLLHVSSHGLKDEGGHLYIAARDTEVAHLDATAVPSEFINRQMAKSLSTRVVLLLDCCYSGAVGRGLSFRAGTGVDLHDLFEGRGRAVITASSATEYAFEEGTVSGRGEPSVFTSAVAAALESGRADRDQDGRVSIDELYEYVCEQVQTQTPHQRPNRYLWTDGPIYVAKSAWKAPVDPKPLPAELLAAASSDHVFHRIGAVDELGRLLTGDDTGLALSAREALESLRTDDSDRVKRRVRTLLAATAASADAEPAPAKPDRTSAVDADRRGGRAATPVGKAARDPGPPGGDPLAEPDDSGGARAGGIPGMPRTASPMPSFLAPPARPAAPARPASDLNPVLFTPAFSPVRTVPTRVEATGRTGTVALGDGGPQIVLGLSILGAIVALAASALPAIRGDVIGDGRSEDFLYNDGVRGFSLWRLLVGEVGGQTFSTPVQDVAVWVGIGAIAAAVLGFAWSTEAESVTRRERLLGLALGQMAVAAVLAAMAVRIAVTADGIHEGPDWESESTSVGIGCWVLLAGAALVGLSAAVGIAGSRSREAAPG